MSGDVIPAEVRDFISARIDSIAQLEALLLLFRDHSQRWDGASIAKRLYIDPGLADDVLQKLSSRGLLVCEPQGFRFRQDDHELYRLTEALSVHYARHLIPVTNLIHNKPSRVQEFADAFKLKKDT